MSEREETSAKEKGAWKGGLLCDEMGLGKTLQSIAVMCKNRPPADAKSKTTLIVCPTSLVRQWFYEIKKWAPGVFENIVIYHGQTKTKRIRDLRTADVVITTYGTLSYQFT
eukprot:UN29607